MFRKFSNMNDFLVQCNESMEKSKNKCAVCYWDETNNSRSLSYQQIFDVSAKITENLKEIIVEHQRICIGLYMKKNHYIPSLMLSLQQCNCAFMFLDPQASGQINTTVCQRLNLKWIISYGDKIDQDNFLSDHCNVIVKFENLIVWKTNLIEKRRVDYENILFVICTSGTTGDSKTVKVTANCIMSNINGLRDKFKLTEDDVIYFGTPLTFDPFIVELFLALTTGCTLVIPPNKRRFSFSNIELLFSETDKHRGVTVIQTVPSLFTKWNDADVEFLLQKSTCRILAFGGEKFPEHVLKLPRSKKLKLFNLYGITEVSCWATIFEVTDSAEVTLGDPLPETVLEVRDIQGTKITEGEGELYIGSNFRVCYVNEDNYSSLSKPVFRATGDLVQVKNGTLIYLARTNNVIKRLGHKVNLLKIQQAVLDSTNIPNACIWIEQLKKLILFVMIKEFDVNTKRKIIDKLRIKLLQILSQEYFPDDIEIVPSLPTTNHGKIDVRTLESIYHNLVNFEENQNVVDIFQLIWCKYLGLSVDSVGMYLQYNFFELGGNSIGVVQCLSEFKERIGVDYPNGLDALLFEKTLRDCCECIKDIEIKIFRKRNYDQSSLQIHSQNIVKMDIKWKYCLNACVDSSPIIINNSMVAIGSFSHSFAILDCISGNAITRIDLPDAVESACSVSPCHKYVYTGCYDGNMYCIEVNTGNIIWKYSTSDRIKCTPRVVEQNNSIIFGSYDKYLHCVDFNRGNTVWKTYLSGSVTSNPFVHQDFVYVATISGTCFCICCLNGKEIWRYDVGVPIFGGPCLISDYDYIIWIDVNGSLHAFACSSGEKIWTFKADGNIFSSLVNVNNYVTFGSSNGKLYCIEIQRHGGKLNYVIKLDSPISSTPNIFEHENEYFCIVATNQGTIYVTDYNKAVVLGKLSLPGEIFSSATVVDTNIYLGCRDNNVYCIKLNIKK